MLMFGLDELRTTGLANHQVYRPGPAEHVWHGLAAQQSQRHRRVIAAPVDGVVANTKQLF